ncbi:CsbD family protein [Fusibacter sp. JL298sf-3]
MNTDILEGKWTQVKGTVKTKWAKFTDDDVAYIDGSKDKLIGKIKEKYGKTKEDAEKEIKAWLDSF